MLGPGEGRVHPASGGHSGTRERAARLRLHHFQQAADAAITLQLALLGIRQAACAAL